ncbi:MAG: hypothetical protein EXS67_02415 [Candidatus Margulisbacteria bacterium]|nr:hypothetical protein [Candidatus Margulisiibacteriota bacterium]
MNSQTQRIIYWLNHQDYSQQHWATVAAECLEKSCQNTEQATVLLSESLHQFHEKFRDAVVKPGNALHDFISMGLDEVDWEEVAKKVLDNAHLSG